MFAWHFVSTSFFEYTPDIRLLRQENYKQSNLQLSLCWNIQFLPLATPLSVTSEQVFCSCQRMINTCFGITDKIRNSIFCCLSFNDDLSVANLFFHSVSPSLFTCQPLVVFFLWRGTVWTWGISPTPHLLRHASTWECHAQSAEYVTVSWRIK